jgi:hypothetical protein
LLGVLPMLSEIVGANKIEQSVPKISRMLLHDFWNGLLGLLHSWYALNFLWSTTSRLTGCHAQMDQVLLPLANRATGAEGQEPHRTPFIVLPAGRTLKESWLRERESYKYFCTFRPLQVSPPLDSKSALPVVCFPN